MNRPKITEKRKKRQKEKENIEGKKKHFLTTASRDEGRETTEGEKL
jgi:hypothetical protein